MTQKQTQCPECTTIYKVSVAQLTMAQGMVCCPKCFNNFNALLHLVELDLQQKSMTPVQVEGAPLHHDYEHEVSDYVVARSYQQTNLLDIFDRKVEHSNIDLHTYLNNLNYFSNEPIQQFPSLKLSEKDHIREKHSLGYYIVWSIINLALLSLLAIQILWFNPDFIGRYPLLTSSFDRACELVECPNLNHRYEQVKIENLSIQRESKNMTRFSGVLMNQGKKSLPLPKLVIRIEQQNTSQEYQLLPNQYLEQSYQGIERLPSQTPFKFSFQLPVAKNEIQHTHLEMIPY